jgi:hypothetical protein
MLQIPLSPDTTKALEERARASGVDVTVYAARLISDGLNAASADELLAPFRKQVEDSRLGDDQLDTLGELLRDEAWQESKGAKTENS